MAKLTSKEVVHASRIIFQYNCRNPKNIIYEVQGNSLAMSKSTGMDWIINHVGGAI